MNKNLIMKNLKGNVIGLLMVAALASVPLSMFFIAFKSPEIIILNDHVAHTNCPQLVTDTVFVELNSSDTKTVDSLNVLVKYWNDRAKDYKFDRDRYIREAGLE